MSHPLIVEAAESFFVPACVYNNTKGDADARVLKEFGERAWNNPVVRFVDAKREDLVPKIDRDWTAPALAGGMAATLRKLGRAVPAWLELIARERPPRRRRLATAIFGMG